MNYPWLGNPSCKPSKTSRVLANRSSFNTRPLEGWSAERLAEGLQAVSMASMESDGLPQVSSAYTGVHARVQASPLARASKM